MRNQLMIEKSAHNCEFDINPYRMYRQKVPVSIWEIFVAKLSPPPPGSHPEGVNKNRSIAEGIRARSSRAPSHSRSWWSIYTPPSSSSVPVPILCCSHRATGERQPDPGFYYLEGDDSSTLLDVAMVTARLSATPFSSPSSSLHHFAAFLFSCRVF